MRQGPNNKQRGRNNGGGNRPYNGGGGNNGAQRRSGVPSRNQNYDSSGPDVRIRGSAYQVYEKYLNLALDATSVGDRIMAESYYQHAEHYYRIINIIEYGPEDERRPSNQNNGQIGGQTGHLYQPGFDGENEENQGDGEEEAQPDQQQYDRSQNQRQGYPERDQQQQQQDGNRFQNNRNQGERPAGERPAAERNQRFDNNQRRDNRRYPNDAAQGEMVTEDGQQQPAQQQSQERQQRDYGQRRDNRPPMNQTENSGADVQMRGNHAPQRSEDVEDEGMLPDFIRRGGPRTQPVETHVDQAAQDDQPE